MSLRYATQANKSEEKRDQSMNNQFEVEVDTLGLVKREKGTLESSQEA